MIALIDMDLVVFRCAASAENDEFGIAIYRAEELLDNILTKVEATSYKAYLSSSSNFRKEIYPEYKAHRTAQKPIHLASLREYAVDKMNAVIAPEGLEADDMLGIDQDKQDGTTTICSLDKDLLQIPGHHFQWEIGTTTWNKPDTFLTQSELEGYRLFYEQCIKGDATDNIKGIPKMGKVRATKELEGCTTELEMFNKVRELYGNDDEFKMNAGCLWILREMDIKFSDKFKELNAVI